MNISPGPNRFICGPAPETRTETVMTLRGNWNYPTAIRFGAGRISELPDACRTLGIKAPLIVTDPGLAGLPMIADATAACIAAGLRSGVFSDVQANPVEANVNAGVAAYKTGAHD